MLKRSVRREAMKWRCADVIFVTFIKKLSCHWVLEVHVKNSNSIDTQKSFLPTLLPILTSYRWPLFRSHWQKCLCWGPCWAPESIMVSPRLWSGDDAQWHGSINAGIIARALQKRDSVLLECVTKKHWEFLVITASIPVQLQLIYFYSIF